MKEKELVSIYLDDMSPNMRTIYEALQQASRANVVDISKQVGLSESTVRRTLMELEKRHLIVRYHGGAFIPQQKGSEPPALKRAMEYPEEKDLIAREAAKRVVPGDCILLTGGSTVASMCTHLRDVDNLTVITDSLLVVQELMYVEQVKLITLGGILNVTEQCLEGMLTSSNIKRLRFSKYFHGIKSINPKDGFLTDDVRQVEFYRECAAQANELYILAASNKFFQEGIAPLFSPGEVDLLITDSGAPEDTVQALRKQDCNVSVVG